MFGLMQSKNQVATLKGSIICKLVECTSQVVPLTK